mgnify:FL=1
MLIANTEKQTEKRKYTGYSPDIPKHLKTIKAVASIGHFDQFVALTFGQLNKCLVLSDIFTGIGVSETFISSLDLLQTP